jgi:hypothetical protein
MPDKQFEMAFSDLAHASLQELAPGLQDHLVGFQLIDKNDSDTQAVGVFGFKVNKRWLYAPVFFLNGALKGQELLYVKDQDLFVPLQDNWVNYLMAKQPYVLGDREEREESDLDIAAPDFSVFGGSPATGNTKWAGAVPFKKMASWALPFAKKYVETIQLVKSAGVVPHKLEDVLAKYPGFAVPLARNMRMNTKFAEAVLQYHSFEELFGGQVKASSQRYTPWSALPSDKIISGIEFGAKAKRAANKTAGTRGVEGILKELTSPIEKSAADQNQTIDDGDDTTTDTEIVTEPSEVVSGEVPVEVLTSGTSADLTDAERSRLQQGEMVIRDHRKNTTSLYKAETSVKVVTPPESGVYDVLTDSGTTKSLVIVDPFTIGDGTTTGTSVVVTSGPKSTLCGTGKVKVTREDVQANKPRAGDFWGQAVKLSKMEVGHHYILITESGKGSVPFKYVGEIGGTDGARYLADQVTYVPCEGSSYGYPVSISTPAASRGRPDITLNSRRNDEAPYEYEHYEKLPYSRYEWESANVIAVNERQGKEIKQSGHTCYVLPDKVRALKISTGSGKQIRKEKIELASSLDVNLLLTKAARLTVFKNGPSYVIGLNDAEAKTYSKKEAMELLLKKANLSVEDMQHVIDNAKERKKTSYVLKAAANDLLGGPSAPSMPAYGGSYDSTLGIPTQTQQSNFSTVQGMQPQPQPEDDLLDDPEVQKIMDASKSGQKDVFDMAVVEGLAKTVDVGAKVDEFIPDMIRGMDRCGRVLFLFYWHNEAFRDRYGRQDLVEMEDSLRNVFKSSGDLCLFLKQKTIESQPEVDSLDINLDALA